MNKFAIGMAIVILSGMFAFTSYAGYTGLGAVTSKTYQTTTNPDGTTTTTTSGGAGVRSVFFPVFIGGGPGSGK